MGVFLGRARGGESVHNLRVSVSLCLEGLPSSRNKCRRSSPTVSNKLYIAGSHVYDEHACVLHTRLSRELSPIAMHSYQKSLALHGSQGKTPCCFIMFWVFFSPKVRESRGGWMKKGRVKPGGCVVGEDEMWEVARESWRRCGCPLMTVYFLSHSLWHRRGQCDVTVRRVHLQVFCFYVYEMCSHERHVCESRVCVCRGLVFHAEQVIKATSQQSSQACKQLQHACKKTGHLKREMNPGQSVLTVLVTGAIRCASGHPRTLQTS